MEISPHPDKLIDWIVSEVRNDSEASVNFQHRETFREVSYRSKKQLGHWSSISVVKMPELRV